MRGGVQNLSGSHAFFSREQRLMARRSELEGLFCDGYFNTG